jgi:ABC transporter substrate binding protein
LFRTSFTFSIADFRLTEKSMIERSWTRFLDSLSDNRKSKIQNRKLVGLSVMAFVLVVTGAAASAQQAKKVPRIGYLSARDRATEFARAAAMRLALRELGYIEGKNIAIEYRYAEGKLDRLPELAAELVRLKVDIIVAGGDPGIRAAMNATKTIPIVLMGQGPILSGLAMLQALPVREATSPALQPLPQN